MKTSLPNRAAFTLIEMLLAAAAAAVILGVLVNVYGRAVHLRNTSAEHTRASRIEARAIDILRADLRNARLSGGKMATTLDTGDSAVHSKFPGDLRFNTTSGRIDEETFAAELLQVEYYIGEDADSPDQKYGALKRSVNRTLLGTLDEPDGEETILTGVESMEVGFFDGSQWQETWDTSTSGTSSASSSTTSTTDSGPAIPLAIRVRLTLAADARPGSSRHMIEVLVPWTTKANPAPPKLPDDTADTGGTGTGTGTGTGAGTGTGTGTGTGGGAR